MQHYLTVVTPAEGEFGVGFWPYPEVRLDGKRVRLLGQSGKLLLGLTITGFGPTRKFLSTARESGHRGGAEDICSF